MSQQIREREIGENITIKHRNINTKTRQVPSSESCERYRKKKSYPTADYRVKSQPTSLRLHMSLLIIITSPVFFFCIFCLRLVRILWNRICHSPAVPSETVTIRLDYKYAHTAIVEPSAAMRAWLIYFRVAPWYFVCAMFPLLLSSRSLACSLENNKIYLTLTLISLSTANWPLYHVWMTFEQARHDGVRTTASHPLTHGRARCTENAPTLNGISRYRELRTLDIILSCVFYFFFLVPVVVRRYHSKKKRFDVCSDLEILANRAGEKEIDNQSNEKH